MMADNEQRSNSETVNGMTEIENRDNQQDMSSTDQQSSRGHTFGDDEMDTAILDTATATSRYCCRAKCEN